MREPLMSSQSEFFNNLRTRAGRGVECAAFPKNFRSCLPFFQIFGVKKSRTPRVVALNYKGRSKSYCSYFFESMATLL